MVHLALCTDGKEMFFDTGTSAKSANTELRHQIIVNPFCSWEYAHAVGTERLQERTVLKLAHDIGRDVVVLKPSVQSITHCGVRRGQQDGH